MENSQLLKNISKGQEPKGQSSWGIDKVPGVASVKKFMGKSTKKQAFDLVLFSAGILLMYKFGKSVADTIDN